MFFLLMPGVVLQHIILKMRFAYLDAEDDYSGW